MGVDCRISLPAKVRVSDVADVVGALLGCAVVKEHFRSGQGWAAHTKNVNVRNGGVVGLCDICTPDRNILYFFEDGNQGNRGMFLRSTAKNIAMAKRLIEFFGGRVDFSDCDDCECDYYVDEQPDINAEDGDAWYRLQEKKLAVTALTENEIAACEQYAAYKNVA